MIQEPNQSTASATKVKVDGKICGCPDVGETVPLTVVTKGTTGEKESKINQQTSQQTGIKHERASNYP